MNEMIDNTGETQHEAGGVPELPECVGMQLMAISEEGDLRWMTARKVKAGDCLLYAMPGWGQAPSLFTAAQMHAYGAQCALAALAARPLSGGWMPIETAPRDGSWFLAYRPKKEGGNGHVAQVHWKCDNLGVMCFGGAGWAYAPKGMPTHWMAMPPAPPAGADEGGR